MQVKHITGTRGHLIIELTDGRLVYAPGELTMDARFYVNISGDWYWAKESARESVLPDATDFYGAVSGNEKEELIHAVKMHQKPGSVRIIFD